MKRRFLAMMIAVGFLLWHAPSRSQEKKVDKGAILFAPSVLFRGELARIAPHLDLTASGCVKIEYVGTKKIVAELETWRDGKAKSSALGWIDAVAAGEVSYSVREVRDDEGKKRYRFTLAAQGTTVQKNVDMPTVNLDLGVSSTNLDKQVPTKDDATVAVWVMTAGRGSDHTRRESIEERARRVEWALVLRITVMKSEAVD
ncbi:MAG: hypothetical protein U0793_26960 [Gemmataceae bacterium]